MKRLTCNDKDVPFSWMESAEGVYHPVMLATVRCHARVDQPGGPSFTVEGNEVYTVPGRYCGNMVVCNNHEPRMLGREWGKVLVGRLVDTEKPA